MEKDTKESAALAEEQEKSVETVETAGKKAQEKAFSSINKRSFLTVVILLGCILLLSGLLSNFVPQGAYLREESGAIIDGTYQKGKTEGIALWRILTAPIRVFASSDALTIIFISLFLLIMSGVFNLLDKTGGIRLILGRTVNKFSKKKRIDS